MLGHAAVSTVDPRGDAMLMMPLGLLRPEI